MSACGNKRKACALRGSNPGPRGCVRVHTLLTNTLGLVSCSLTLRKENKETLLFRFAGNGADGGGASRRNRKREGDGGVPIPGRSGGRGGPVVEVADA